MTGESYEHSANRETHRFIMHFNADEGLYATVLDFAFTRLVEEKEITYYDLGRAVVEYVKDTVLPTADKEFARMVNSDIGSWYRIDYTEVGEAVRDAIDTEGMTR